MNVKEILVSWLKSHGYDGLYSEDCGCSIDNLFLCGGNSFFEDCKPGVKSESNESTIIGPRKEKQPEEICKELKCAGVDDKCPGNPLCPAVIFQQENQPDCKKAVEYMRKQIDLSMRCSYCHGKNSIECQHCEGTGKEPDKLLEKK